MTPARTGTPGYMPVENLSSAIEAGPDGDVFSFAVLMLVAFVRPELRENNMFAHPVRYHDDTIVLILSRIYLVYDTYLFMINTYVQAVVPATRNSG